MAAVLLLTVAVTGTLAAVYGMRQLFLPLNTHQLPLKIIICCSGGTKPENLVINDNETWLKVYAEEICGTGNSCVPAPTVNFTSSTVVAVLAGFKPTAGYAVNITEVILNGSGILVRTMLTAPGPSCLVAQVVTYPAQVATIAKTHLPVTFEAQPTHFRSC